MRQILLILTALALPASALAQERRAPRETRPAATQNGTESLSRHLDAALALDAAFRALQAQRDAAAARGAQVRSPFAGSPFVGGNARSDLRGPNRVGEFELEAGAPLWLPGQRGALAGTVQFAVADVEARIALRRLEVAGLLRETWWDAAEARRAAQLARDRLATARQIGQAVTRRAQLGDIPPTEALLARNEVLGAELALAQAEAAATQTLAAYRTLTGGLEPNLPQEAPRPEIAGHPALQAGEASLAAAQARQRLVVTTPRDNPEVMVFGRQETGNLSSEGTSLGLRFRLPLATEARNAPRRADAQSEVTRAEAELAQARRLVQAEVT
ncbi:MAG: TolC family protein, partial [Acetobacteraceae bacterium]|nr:TolC family protein [Acetobacteraceae bacterium]